MAPHFLFKTSTTNWKVAAMVKMPNTIESKTLIVSQVVAWS